MTVSAVYDELVEHLNSMPIGAPKTPELTHWFRGPRRNRGPSCLWENS
jgi:hypothetical protein